METTTNNTTENSFKKFILDAGLIVALVTFGSYLLTYTNRLGYSLIMGLPLEFIDIQLNNIIQTCFYFLLSIALTMILVGLIELSTKRIKGKWYLYFYSYQREHYMLLIGIYFLLTLTIDLRYNYFYFNMLFWIFNANIQYFKIYRKLDRTKLSTQYPYHNIKDKFNNYTMNILIYYAAGLILTFVIGYLNANGQTEFETIKLEKEYIVLTKSENNYICTTFDNDSLRTFSKFYILEYSLLSENKSPIEKKYIGIIKYNGIR